MKIFQSWKWMSQQNLNAIPKVPKGIHRLPIKPVEKRFNPWLMPLLLGTGLGVAIALGGMHVLSNRPPTQQITAANKPEKTVAASMTVTLARVETAHL
jgi:hypothetical protein